MLRGLLRLTWLEIKIFVREPLGVFGSVLPIVIFIGFGRLFGSRMRSVPANVPAVIYRDLPVFSSLLIAISAVLSLVTIIAVYREGGILRRLRATPLRPHTILTAHVLVKLLFTTATLAAMVLAGRRYYPMEAGVSLLSYTMALLFSTVTILSLGFVIASVVPTARFAQPIGTLILYPMLAVTGLFASVESMPPVMRIVARAVPLTYSVSLLRGIWRGESWTAHTGDVLVLVVLFVAFTALSAKVFRWE